MRNYLLKTIATCAVALAAFSCDSEGTIHVTGVVIDDRGTTLSMNKGETAAMTCLVMPQDATDQSITWSSDNEAVATVDENGEVTAVQYGDATITVTTTDDKQTSTRKVKVYGDVMAFTLTNDGNGTAAATVDGTAANSARVLKTVTIKATSSAGYSFLKWEVVSGTVTIANANAATTTFVMPAAPVTIKATFQEDETPPFAYTDLLGAYNATGTPDLLNQPGPATWTGDVSQPSDQSQDYYVVTKFGGTTINVFVNVDIPNKTLTIDGETLLGKNQAQTLNAYFRAIYYDESTRQFFDIADYQVKWNAATRTIDMTGKYEGSDVLVGVFGYNVSDGKLAAGFSDGYIGCKLVVAASGGAPMFTGINATRGTKIGNSELLDFGDFKYGGTVQFDPAKFSRE